MASALALACAGCGDDDRSASPALSAHELCAPAHLRHEHELGPARRASFDAITVVHMEHANAEAVDARDTGTAGVDEIPYVLTRGATRRFGVGPGPVAHATLRDERGRTIVDVARGETSPAIALAPGAYTLALTSDAGADAIIAVAPEACGASRASASSEAIAGGSHAPGLGDPSTDGARAQRTDAALVATPATPGVYVQELPAVRTIQGTDTTTPAFVGATTAGTVGPQLVTSLDGYTATFGAPSAASFVSLAVAQFFANGGTSAWVVATSTSGTAPTAAELTAGLDMLDPVQGYFTLALPDLARLDPSDAATVAIAATAYGARSGKFVVVDLPVTLTAPADVVTWAKGISTAPLAGDPANAAVYFPPLASTVPGTGATVTTGSSGVVTGIYAATDASVGVWEAPAGLTHGVVAPGTPTAVVVTSGDVDVLDAGAVNSIRTLPQYGELIWGAETLVAALPSPKQYIPARRTLLMIEQSLRESLQWVVFEPNDSSLWSAVTSDVSAFLATLYAEGALVGATSSQAFSVVCDATNNPPEMRQLGTLSVDISVALVEPAEFVVIRFQQQTAGPDSGD